MVIGLALGFRIKVLLSETMLHKEVGNWCCFLKKEYILCTYYSFPSLCRSPVAAHWCKHTGSSINELPSDWQQDPALLRKLFDSRSNLTHRCLHLCLLDTIGHNVFQHPVQPLCLLAQSHYIMMFSLRSETVSIKVKTVTCLANTSGSSSHLPRTHLVPSSFSSCLTRWSLPAVLSLVSTARCSCSVW